MTYSGLRARKRWYGCPPACPLSLEEWIPYLAKPGSSGGQSMQPVWRGPSASLASAWDAGQELMQPLCRAHLREDAASFVHWEVHLDAATARARGFA